MYSQGVTGATRLQHQVKKLVLQAGFEPGSRGQQGISWEQETENSISRSWRGEQVHKNNGAFG